MAAVSAPSQILTRLARSILLRAGIETPEDWALSSMETAGSLGWHVVGRRCRIVGGQREFHGPSIALYVPEEEIAQAIGEAIE